MLTLPAWVLQELMDLLPVIQAEELRNQALVAMLPHMKEHDRRRVLRKLDAARARQARAPIEVVEVDPDKARAYFAALGAKVHA